MTRGVGQDHVWPILLTWQKFCNAVCRGIWSSPTQLPVASFVISYPMVLIFTVLCCFVEISKFSISRERNNYEEFVVAHTDTLYTSYTFI